MIQISIIIPTYEPKEYLNECIQSIAMQTFPMDKVEIIVVLNGAKHPFYESIEASLQGSGLVHTKLIFCTHTHVSSARNEGLLAAKGDYIMFMDDDDKISAGYIESMIPEATPEGVVFSNIKTFSEDDSLAEDINMTRTYQKNLGIANPNWMTLRSHMSVVWGKLIPKSMVQGKHFDPKFKNGQDALFMGLISNQIREYKLAKGDAVYYWRIRKGSASRKSNKVSYEIKNTFNLMAAYLKIYFSAPFSYNILFFSSRVLAVIKRLSRRIPLSRW